MTTTVSAMARDGINGSVSLEVEGDSEHEVKDPVVDEEAQSNGVVLSRELSNEEDGTDGLAEPLLLVKEKREVDFCRDGREQGSPPELLDLAACIRKAMGAVVKFVGFVVHGGQDGGKRKNGGDSRIGLGTSVFEFFKRCQKALMRRRLERTVQVLMQAHHESAKASTEQSRLERQDSLLHLGHMGAALFRPLDAAFDDEKQVEGSSEQTGTETASLVRSEQEEKEEMQREEARRLNPFGNKRLAQSERGKYHDYGHLSRSTRSLDANPDSGRVSPQYQDLSRRASLLQVPHMQQQTDLTYDPYVSLEQTEPSPTALQDYPPVLSPSVMLELIDRGLPPALGLTKSWTRVFSVARDGDDFYTFLHKVHGHKHTVLAIRTTADDIIGGYADSEWSTNHEHRASFYGTGKSFIFKVSRSGDSSSIGKLGTSPTAVYMNLDEDSDEEASKKQVSGSTDDATQVSSSTSGSSEQPQSESVHIYKWTGKNHYNQFCSPHDGRIAMGGGGYKGSFGICVQDCFQQGTSGHCETYGNQEPLTRTSRFDVVDFEVYGLVNSW